MADEQAHFVLHRGEAARGKAVVRPGEVPSRRNGVHGAGVSGLSPRHSAAAAVDRAGVQARDLQEVPVGDRQGTRGRGGMPAVPNKALPVP
jgi:hypothetical protein